MDQLLSCKIAQMCNVCIQAFAVLLAPTVKNKPLIGFVDIVDCILFKFLYDQCEIALIFWCQIEVIVHVFTASRPMQYKNRTTL